MASVTRLLGALRPKTVEGTMVGNAIDVAASVDPLRNLLRVTRRALMAVILVA
jgi:hypothetical protein